MKISYVVTFETPHLRAVSPAEIEHVRALLFATVRKATEDTTHVTVEPLTGKPPHPFPTP